MVADAAIKVLSDKDMSYFLDITDSPNPVIRRINLWFPIRTRLEPSLDAYKFFADQNPPYPPGSEEDARGPASVSHWKRGIDLRSDGLQLLPRWPTVAGE
jgi:hypothetical protein